jgi:bacterioferritin
MHINQSRIEKFFATVKAQEETKKKEDVVACLNDLLLDEYLQRDLYESYAYLLFGPEAIAVQEHLQGHLDDEMDHIKILQRYIVTLGGLPTLDRKPITVIEPLEFYAILEKDLELEHTAVSKYSKAIADLEGSTEFTALKIDLENILAQEMEHVHDLVLWLKPY